MPGAKVPIEQTLCCHNSVSQSLVSAASYQYSVPYIFR